MALPSEYMSPKEFADHMGMDVNRVRNELRQDAEREIKKYPFAIAIQNEKTGTWIYRIHRQRFQKWERGELADIGQIASLVAEKVIEHLQDETGIITIR